MSRGLDHRRARIALVAGDRRADQHEAGLVRHHMDDAAAGDRQGIADSGCRGRA